MRQMNLREKIGQMIMTGFQALELTQDIIELIDQYKISNIVLFSYNIKTMEQARNLCRKLHERIEQSTGHPAFIAVDQEGGVVTRLPNEAGNIPGAMLIGAAGKKEYAYRAGKITGTQLKSLGINVDFAPVLDVNSNPDNPVIGVRSYSGDAGKVKEFGLNMMEGLLDCGVMATVKHFPGHGDTAVDSHLGLPVVERDMEELEKNELIPFQSAIDQGVPGIMTTHILFPKLEKERKPATISNRILTGILREKMGFEGIIFTDCLEMAAIQNFYGTAKSAVEAVKAGAQILCISHTKALVIEAVHFIEAAVQSGEIPIELIDRAVDNILKYKEQFRMNENPEEISLEQNREFMKEIEVMALAGITRVSKETLPDITDNSIVIGSYAYRSTLANSLADKGLHFAEYMSEKLNCQYLDIPLNPGKEELNRILSELESYPLIIYGLYNGHLNLGQIELANEISRAGHTLVAVTLRNPYDLAYLDCRIHKVAAYEYNTTVFDALVKVLKREAEFQGRLPVRLQQEQTAEC